MTPEEQAAANTITAAHTFAVVQHGQQIADAAFRWALRNHGNEVLMKATSLLPAALAQEVITGALHNSCDGSDSDGDGGDGFADAQWYALRRKQKAERRAR